METPITSTANDSGTGLLLSARTRLLLLILVVLLFALRNVPWHLDDYDQAKQAFTSLEMVRDGNWLVQHTPSGRTATKPPLQGWASAAIQMAISCWPLALRLPPFLAALALLLLLYREGDRLLPGDGGILAAAAFGLNMISIRLATLVRTDMLLACLITVCGLILLRKCRDGIPWATRDRLLLALVLMLSLFVKGPVAYGVLLPGLLLLLALPQTRPAARAMWPGFWPLLVPFLPFAIWLFAATRAEPDFHHDVVQTEFLARFGFGGDDAKSRPLYWYLPHIIQKFAPWSVLIAGLLFIRDVRDRIARRTDLLWLAVWSGGAILLFSLLPSKRVDRIYPALLPLCLLLPGLVSLLPEVTTRIRRILSVALLAALFYQGGYAIQLVAAKNRENAGALSAFAREAKSVVDRESLRIAVVSPPNESLFCYMNETRKWSVDQAASAWRKREIDALIIDQSGFESARSKFPGAIIRSSSEPPAPAVLFVTHETRPSPP